jgi:hypothetical protein
MTMTYIVYRSRDSAVGIANGYGLNDRGGRSSSPGGGKNFYLSMSSRLALGSTQPPIQWAPGAFSPGVKWLKREADHSPSSNAEVNKTWSIHPLPNTSSWHSV